MKTKRRPVFSFEIDEDRMVESIASKVVAKVIAKLALFTGKAKLEADAPAMRPFPVFCEANGISQTYGRGEIRAGRLRVRKCGKLTMVTAEDERAWRASLPSGTGPAPCVKKPSNRPNEEERAWP
jgi:hypothetical protein